MPYELPSLPYAHDALEPTIDAQTMQIHHGKHHQAYVDNLNKALDGTEWDGKPIEQVLGVLDALPEDKQGPVRNNGGGHANHSLFWQIMKPGGGGDPSGALADAIADTFGDVDQLQGAERRRRQALRLRLDLARLGRHRPRGLLDPEPGQPVDAGRRAAARHRRLGARLLPAATRTAVPTTSARGGTSSTGTRSHAATTRRAAAESRHERARASTALARASRLVRSGAR